MTPEEEAYRRTVQEETRRGKAEFLRLVQAQK